MFVVLLLSLHVIATLVWVGGMAFAYWVLRPSVPVLEPSQRMTLWRAVFARFLPIVGIAVLVLLITGYAMVLGPLGGFGAVGHSVHIMMILGWIMVGLYGHLYFAPWQRFRRAVDGGDMEKAARNLTGMRLLVMINLGLGLVTTVVGATGRYWPV